MADHRAVELLLLRAVPQPPHDPVVAGEAVPGDEAVERGFDAVAAQVVVVEADQFGAGHDAARSEADSCGGVGGDVAVVAGEHAQRDPGGFEAPDGVADAGFGWVLEGEQPAEGQVAFVVGVHVVEVGCKAGGDTQHPVAVGAELFVAAQDHLPSGLVEWDVGGVLSERGARVEHRR